MTHTEVILPGATFGILGDGQLGRMLAIAGARLGYKVAVLGPGGRESPAGHVAYWAEAWASGGEVSDELLDEFCKLVSVVLIEWENIPVSLVKRIEARGVPVCPNSNVLRIAQDRALEKEYAEYAGILTPQWDVIGDGIFGLHLDERADVVKVDSILKTRHDGYDGKGQIRLKPGDRISKAWEALGRRPCVLERVVDFVCEVSVITARVPQTDAAEPAIVQYGPFENTHHDGILRVTRYPPHNEKVKPISYRIPNEALLAAAKIADVLKVHGLLAVEFFVDVHGQLIFNEIAPRPHNSGHLTIDCCHTCQFEQHVRAACNIGLRPVHFHSHGVMFNMIGEEIENWNRNPGRPEKIVHIYGKGETRPDRKMGHITRVICK